MTGVSSPTRTVSAATDGYACPIGGTKAAVCGERLEAYTMGGVHDQGQGQYTGCLVDLTVLSYLNAIRWHGKIAQRHPCIAINGYVSRHRLCDHSPDQPLQPIPPTEPPRPSPRPPTFHSSSSRTESGSYCPVILCGWSYLQLDASLPAPAPPFVSCTTAYSSV
eukprot:COSAG05_NODE_352_length_10911_cov_31.817139_12_plen_164_part_00